MIHSYAGPIPHQYALVDGGMVSVDIPAGQFLPCVWFGIVSYPGRMWGCQILLENGVYYRNVPLHTMASTSDAVDWRPADAQTWDCYGYDFAVIEYPFLKGMEVIARCGDNVYTGQYLFSVAPLKDGFSDWPEQNKEFLFLRLENGRFTAQPTNRVLVNDKSFVEIDWESESPFPSGIIRQTQIFCCE